MNLPMQKVSIEGMRGDYSRYALTQHNAVQRGLKKAKEKLFSPVAERWPGKHLQIVDLGSADGVNGFSVIDAIGRTLQPDNAESKPQLAVAHVDVPTADFKSLTDNIYNHPHSYYHSLQGLFEVQPSIAPGSFYSSYIEAQSADIVFSTTSLHYASKSAGEITGHIEPLYAAGKQREPWAALSRFDLDQVMTQAHRALGKGGAFWAVAPAHTTNDLGQIHNHWNKEVWNIMIALLNQMDHAGDIDSQTWRDFVIPVHQRHINEWQNWFDKNTEKFQLEFLEVVESANPYLDFYHNGHKNPQQFADDYLGFFKAWGERIISTLVSNELQRETFYKKLHAAFKAEPDRFENDNVSVYVGAIKR